MNKKYFTVINILNKTGIGYFVFIDSLPFLGIKGRCGYWFFLLVSAVCFSTKRGMLNCWPQVYGTVYEKKRKEKQNRVDDSDYIG